MNTVDDGNGTACDNQPCGRYIWIAYAKKPPYLPVAAADSAEELAAKVGTSKGTIVSAWSRYRHGKLRRSRYHRVYVGYDPQFESEATL